MNKSNQQYKAMKKFEFKPFDKVLVRSGNNAIWKPQWYSHKDGKDYVTMDGSFNLQCIPYEGNEHLVKSIDSYVEPKYEPKYEPQNGDFVYVETIDAGCMIVFQERTDLYFSFNAQRDSVDMISSFGFPYGDIKSIRPATEEEKDQFLSKLHKIGKDLDAEKKEIVDWEWKPSMGERYYYPLYRMLNGGFEVNTSRWAHDILDLARKEKNLVSRTEEECQAMCDKLNEAIKNVK